MGGVFTKEVLLWPFGQKSEKATPPPPKLPDPLAVPEVKQEEAGDLAKRRAIRRRGRGKTVITGALEPETKGKTLLG